MSQQVKFNLPNGWQLDRKIDSDYFYRYNYDYYWVKKEVEDIPVRAILLRLNHTRVKDKWAARSLYASFEKMVDAITRNISFLPEVLYFDYVESDAHMGKEPILILYPIKSIKNTFSIPFKRKDKYRIAAYRAKDLAYLIKNLHKNDVIAREFPRRSIVYSDGKYHFFKFASLIGQDDFGGYNQSDLVLEPQKIFSAPECFEPQGELSFATDVYAFGKLILQLFMKDSDYIDYFENNPFPNKAEYENLLNKLSIPIELRRFMLICLANDPSLRFSSMYDIIGYLKHNVLNSSQKSHSVYSKNQGVLGVYFGELTRDNYFNHQKLRKLILNEKLNLSTRYFFHYHPLRGFKGYLKANLRIKNYVKFDRKKEENRLKENLNSYLDDDKTLVFITDEKEEIKNYLDGILPDIKKLIYIAPENEFYGNEKVKYYDVQDFLSPK